MKEATQQLRTIDAVVKAYRRVAIWAIMGALAFAVVAIGFIFLYFQRSSAQVFLARDFTAVERVLDEKAMIIQHTKNFYSLFFEADQSSFKSRTNDALYLIGESGKELRDRFSEGGWYRQIVQNNVVLTVDVDSIDVNMNIYPYQVQVFAKQNIKRESNVITRYLNSSFEVIKVANDIKNPFGLRIDKFLITNNKEYVKEQR